MVTTEENTLSAADGSSVRRLICAEDLPTLQAFALAKWRERSIEHRAPEPEDLSSSCKFTALLVQGLLGGTICGNWHHIHVRLPNGAIVDLNSGANDVRQLQIEGVDPYRHDERFIASRDFKKSLSSCKPRVRGWLNEWATTAGPNVLPNVCLATSNIVA